MGMGVVMTAMIALVALDAGPKGAGSRVPYFVVELELGPPAGTPPPPIPPPARTPAEQVQRTALLEKPRPGAAVLHVILVNGSSQPVDLRGLQSLRPEVLDGAGRPLELSDVRALERPHPDAVAAPPPPPELLDAGQRREVVRWTVSPRERQMILDVPYGNAALAGRVTLAARFTFAVRDSLDEFQRRLEYSYRHFGRSEAQARTDAAADAERYRASYDRLAGAWTGEARSARYQLTVP